MRHRPPRASDYRGSCKSCGRQFEFDRCTRCHEFHPINMCDCPDTTTTSVEVENLKVDQDGRRLFGLSPLKGAGESARLCCAFCARPKPYEKSAADFRGECRSCGRRFEFGQCICCRQFYPTNMCACSPGKIVKTRGFVRRVALKVDQDGRSLEDSVEFLEEGPIWKWGPGYYCENCCMPGR